jgi:outer membrane protein assembly factor BamB
MPARVPGFFILLTGFVTAATAADWPQWRGPNRDGKSAEKGLLTRWPEGGPRLLWKVETLGAGYGSVAVIGDRLYVLGGESATEVKPEFLQCLDPTDGKELWRTVLNPSPSGPPNLGQTFNSWGGGPRSTPTIDGDAVYALGSTGDLVRVHRNSGTLVWRKHLVQDFGGGVPKWAYSESPLVDGDHVVCTPGGKGGMVAVNKKTGEPVWQCKEIGDAAGYSSIVVAEAGGVHQYIQQTMQSALGVRATDGKLLWKVNQLKRNIAVIPTPVVAGDLVFFTAGYNAGCELIRLAPDGAGGTRATIVYTRNDSVSNHHGGVIELGGRIYGHNNRQWVCFDYKTGGEAILWSSGKLDKGSITYADGHFICYGEGKGTVVLIAATPEEWREVSRFELPVKSKIRPAGGRFWPHPVVANGRLYLRDMEFLCCYEIGRPGA